MLDYLIKFNALPKNLRDQVSTPKMVAQINELEQKYQVSLAVLVMRLMVKEISFLELSSYLTDNFKLTIDRIEALSNELETKIFFGLTEYLGINAVKSSDHQLMKISKAGLPKLAGLSEAEIELQELADDLKELPKAIESPAKNPERDETLDRIIKQIQINFSSQLLVDRFRQILSTYLRGIRSKIDTKATLTKAFAAGGLSFDEQSADKVLNTLENLTRSTAGFKASPPKKIILPEDSLEALKAVGARDIEFDLAKSIAQKKENPQQAVETAAKPEPPLSLKNLAETSLANNQAAGQGLSTGTEKIIFRRPTETNNKKKIEDVKAMPKTMGPIDELKFLDLANFRRLDKDPVRAVLKIKEKIDFLESEQYSLRFLAIKAWRQCPVNRLYLSIGEEAIASNRLVSEVISGNLARDDNYLNNSEFEAIMSLNKDLRF